MELPACAASAASKAGSSTSILSAAALRFSEAPTATVVGCFSKVSTIRADSNEVVLMSGEMASPWAISTGAVGLQQRLANGAELRCLAW